MGFSMNSTIIPEFPFGMALEIPKEIRLEIISGNPLKINSRISLGMFLRITLRVLLRIYATNLLGITARIRLLIFQEISPGFLSKMPLWIPSGMLLEISNI